MESAPSSPPHRDTPAASEVILDNATPLAASLASAAARTYFELFLISFVLLFFELTCIRWFASVVIFLTFFTNLVLMACFLGMSIGCLAAGRTRDYVRTTLPLAFLAAATALGVAWAYNHYGQWAIDVGGQQSPQMVYFGTEYRAKDPSKFLVPVELIGGTFFVLIAGMFIGLGQVLGRALTAVPDRIKGYSANILGSLAGIAAFGAASYWHTNPHVWFAVSATICLYFTRPWNWVQIGSQTALLLLVAISAYGLDESRGETYWSPYYKIHFDPRTAAINVNNLAHQDMHDMRTFQGAYGLPHELLRLAKQPVTKNMLVIGAGSGNDVAAALLAGVGHIDAVEIDPRIGQIGKEEHPNHPYDDPQRVTRYFDDGRSFVRKTGSQYDLALYALVDSLVLHSGYSSLRLESFLFTRQAFSDIREKVKPGGIFVMYNYYRQGWIVARLAKMAELVFGVKPIVISLPYQEKISPSDSQADHFTVVMVSNGHSDALEAIREALREPVQSSALRVAKDAEEKTADEASSDTTVRLAAATRQIGMARVDTSTTDLLPTDDWPFLYLKAPQIPFKPSVTGMLLIAGLSVGMLLYFAPERRLKPNGQMFFLGAGFMLLETRGVTQMALLFGSTWVVNSVVFAAILVMVLLSNVTVVLAKPQRVWPAYAALAVGLLINLCIPLESFLALGSSDVRGVLACAVVFVPVYFAGIIFSTAFRDSTQPDVDFGSNIAGVILGGLSEYFSLIIGFKLLLVLALAYYALSMVALRRTVSVT